MRSGAINFVINSQRDNKVLSELIPDISSKYDELPYIIIYIPLNISEKPTTSFNMCGPQILSLFVNYSMHNIETVK